MTTNERMEIYYRGAMAEFPLCANCKHFYPHYLPDSLHGGFRRMDAGHCSFPRFKYRKAYDTCEKFEGRG